MPGTACSFHNVQLTTHVGFRFSLQMSRPNHTVKSSPAEVKAAKPDFLLHFLPEETSECRRETFPNRTLPLLWL